MSRTRVSTTAREPCPLRGSRAPCLRYIPYQLNSAARAAAGTLTQQSDSRKARRPEAALQSSSVHSAPQCALNMHTQCQAPIILYMLCSAPSPCRFPGQPLRLNHCGTYLASAYLPSTACSLAGCVRSCRCQQLAPLTADSQHLASKQSDTDCKAFRLLPRLSVKTQLVCRRAGTLSGWQQRPVDRNSEVCLRCSRP